MKNSHHWREIMRGLNEDDIREVETWYARRYPKLTKFADVHGKKTQAQKV